MSNVLSFPLSPLDGVITAIGDEINELFGRRLTRTVGPHSEGATTLNVETTFGWDDTGRIYLDGKRYDYTGRVEVPAQLTGLSSPGAFFTGLLSDIRELSTVADGTGTFSGLDIARRMLLVDFAEGEFLDVIARNYGLERTFGMDDATLRLVIKALAFLPRGTVYALELLLDLILGAGNYTLFEDLIGFPNRVFITFNTQLTSEEFTGKAFYNDRDEQTSSNTTTVQTTYDPIQGRDSVYAVLLAPETHRADFDALPSAEATTPWTYSGGIAEGTFAVDNTDSSFSLVDADGANDGRYTRTLRAEPETQIVAKWRMKRNSAAGSPVAAALRVSNGARDVVVGWDGTNVHFEAGGAVIGGTTFAIDAAYHDYMLVIPGSKDGVVTVELHVDDVLVVSEPIASFDADATRTVAFGALSAAGTSDTDWTYLVVDTVDIEHNYWNGRENGDAEMDGVDLDRVTSTGTLFVAASEDITRTVRISGGTLNHGRANGLYKIAAVDGAGAFIDVTGIQHTANNTEEEGEAITADRFRVSPTFDPFVAEDAGIQALLSTGSVGANDGIDWEAVHGGDDGDNISVEFIDSPALPSVQVVVVDPGSGFVEAIQITLDDGVHTANEVITAVQANAVSDALVNVVVTPGSTGAGFPGAGGPTSLAGGDAGKSLTISGSTAAPVNDGTYPISTLISATEVLLGTHRAPADPQALGSSSLQVEQQLDWRKEPNFPLEAGLTWESIAVGTVVTDVLTLRRALPAATTDVVVLYTTVLSAQVLLNEFVDNTDADTYYPFYLADPFAFLRRLIEDVTVAGVIPLFG